ncbi:hypothetical protein WG909_14250 [Peptostreptococcaceae bacterium AGR-M142]
MDNKDFKKQDMDILKAIKENQRQKRLKDKEESKKESEVFIEGDLYDFVDGYFYEDRLYMKIPKDFVDMAKEIKDIKYPYIDRPEIIKTDKNSEIDITFKIIDQDITEDRVHELTLGMKTMLKRMNPSNLILSEGLKNINSKNIGFLEMKTTAIDGYIYNLIFFMVFEGKVLMGKVACLYDKHKIWKDLGFMMMDSVKVLY